MHDEQTGVVRAQRIPADGRVGDHLDAAHFARIAADLHAQTGQPETIEAVLRYSVQTIGATWASVALLRHRGRLLEVVGATDDIARRADEVQLGVGQGPYLNSTVLTDIDSVLVTRVDYEERWPEWARAVYDLGVRAVLSVELGTSRQRLGALNLYADEVDRFSDDDIELARILARHAAIALDRTRREANLSRAIDSQQSIGQALGILMERFGIDADQAFAVLRRYSQDANLKLRDVAQRLVETRLLPSQMPSDPDAG